MIERAGAGRPRDPDVARRVIAVTLDLLHCGGYGRLRIDDIARASGVAKTTIYRRWPSLDALVVAAAEAAIGPRPLPSTGDLEEDLRVLLRLASGSFLRGDGSATPRQLLGVELMRYPGLAELYRARIIDPLRDHAIALIQAGIRQGRFRADTDPALVVDMAIGPVIYRWILPGGELPETAVETIASLLLRSIRV